MRRRVPARHGLAALLAVLLSILLFAGCAKKAPQSASPPANSPALDLVFAVAGDSRSDHKWMNPKKSPDYGKYVNEGALKALRGDIIDKGQGKPGFFFVHLGDFGIRGGQPIFAEFKKTMDKLTKAKIPLYPAIGNHEIRYYVPKKTGNAEAPLNGLKSQGEYQAAFSKPWFMPADASFPDGYEGLAYNFRRGSTAFIVMDSYYVSAESTPTYQKGYYSDAHLKWLQDQLIACSKDASVKHVFVMSHQPAFNAATGDGKLYQYYNPPASTRSNWIMWALMNKYKVDAYFCGHSHFYHRWDVQGSRFEHEYSANWAPLGSEFDDSGIKEYASPSFSGWPHTIPQVLNGTCGAPLQSLKKNLVKDKKKRVPRQGGAKEYNFSIVTIEGDTVTVEVYAYSRGGSITSPYQIDRFQKKGGAWQTLPPE